MSERGFTINYKHDTDVFLIGKVIRLHYTLRVLLIHTNDMADRLNVSEEVPFSIVLINIEHLVRRLCKDQYTDVSFSLDISIKEKKEAYGK